MGENDNKSRMSEPQPFSVLATVGLSSGVMISGEDAGREEWKRTTAVNLVSSALE